MQVTRRQNFRSITGCLDFVCRLVFLAEHNRIWKGGKEDAYCSFGSVRKAGLSAVLGSATGVHRIVSGSPTVIQSRIMVSPHDRSKIDLSAE